jgi:cyanate lyase
MEQAMNGAKAALGRKILTIKKRKGLTWPEIVQRLGHSTVFVCAGCPTRRATG